MYTHPGALYIIVGRRLEVCEFAAGLSTASKVARYGEKMRIYTSICMYAVRIYIIGRAHS